MLDQNLHKLKVQLKLAVNRLRLTQAKKAAIAKQQRRELATLLENGKEDFARIKCEHLIQEDINVEMLSMIELYCELLLARAGLLDSRQCDPGLEEGVKTIIHAAPRCDVKELSVVREMLAAKFGKEFAISAIENSDNKVNARVLQKLRIDPPKPELVELYLQEIARTYGVPWGSPDATAIDQNREDEDSGDDGPSDGKIVERPSAIPVENSQDLPQTPGSDPSRASISVAPASPTSENPAPRIHLPNEKLAGARRRASSTRSSAPKQGPNNSRPEGNVPSFDELTARFEALKRNA